MHNFFQKLVDKYCIYIIFSLYSLAILLMPQLKLAAHHATYYDLGVLGHQILVGDSIRDGFIGHAYFFYPLLKLLVSYAPHIGLEIIILVQSVIILVASLIVLIGYGRFSFFLFVIAFPVWWIALFDFHYEFLLLPLMLCFFIFYDKKQNYILAFLMAMLVGMVKEPYWLTSIAMGFYAFFSGFSSNKNNKPFVNKQHCVGFLIIIFSFLGFYLSEKYFIQRPFVNLVQITNTGSGFDWVLDLIRNSQVFTTESIKIFFDVLFSDWRKLYPFLVLFLIFPPLFLGKRLALVVAVPTILLMLLSENHLHYSLGSHYYLSLVVPVIICASGINIKPIMLAIPLAGHIILSGSFISVLFWSGYSWSFNYSSYMKTTDDSMLDEYVKNEIKLVDSVVIQNNIVSTRLVAREYLNVFPEYYSHINTNYNKQYIILANGRPLFLNDKSCDWIFGECRNKSFVAKFHSEIAELKKSYKLEKVIGDYLVYKKDHASQTN